MTKNNIKTVLFASLIAAMIIPLGNAFAETSVDKTKQDFKEEVKEWLLDTKADKQTPSEKTEELKSKYDLLLRESIEKSRIETNTKKLTEQEIQSAINYITLETIKDEKIKLLQEKQLSSVSYTNFLNWFGVQTAEASCPATTHPAYKQVRIDINGGSYGEYYFGGNNNLYLVSYTDDPSTCERTYILYFFDEDHPTSDSMYDDFRSDWYGRIVDIESFTIKNNNQIEFDNSWSNSDDFDCLRLGAFGCHSSATLPYIPGQTIYVSNTWNHMMGIADTNTSISKVLVP